MPTEADLSDGWRKTPRSMLPALILPYQYAAGRQPTASRIDLPDGMLREMVEDLKDGGPVPIRVPIFANTNSDEIRTVVESLLRELENRTHLQLAIMPFDEGCTGAITLDDHDGRDNPEIKFCLVPVDARACDMTLDEIVAHYT